jgi:cell wall-associated NlpC family hydrolase
VGRRLAALAAVSALVPAGTALAARGGVPNWAAPQIRAVVAHGLLGGVGGAAFRPNDPLTRQQLADLTFGLGLELVPTAPTLPPAPVPAAPPAPDPAAPPVPGTTSTTVTTTAPTEATTQASPAPALAPAPAGAPQVSNPDGTVSLAALDARLVSALGLSDAAAEFAAGAKAAGLPIPARFGTEVVARLLGLRMNHPAAQDSLELLPADPATRAEAAYSAARILQFGWLGNSWQTAAVRSLADSFALPQLDDWQSRILTVAVSKVGMPYVWGGTSDRTETPFGVRARGGYDCSGFVWRVFKLQSYPDEGSLASTLRGRTTFAMSVEVPRSQRIPFAQLQPADVLFFGDRGPRSTSAQVGHAGIYLGNGWFVHSSDQGVALGRLDGWYRREFAWARRPLLEAGLDGA